MLSIQVLIMMIMKDTQKSSNYLSAVFANKCPRCREGKLFVSNKPYAFKNNEFMKMNERCPVCHQATDIEVGFYYGTSYVSYALTVAFSVSTFVAWKVFIGMTFSVDDNRVFYWFFLNLVLLLFMQPLFMRFARSLWLSWFVKYDPNWKENEAQKNERIVKEYMKAW